MLRNPLQTLSEKKTERADIVICMPTRGSLTIETHQALISNINGLKTVFASIARKPVDVARNESARAVIDLRSRVEFDFALWVDDDAWWPAGTVPRLLDGMRQHREIDMLSGYCGRRQANSAPTTLRSLIDPASFPRQGIDCEPGSIVEVEAVPFHFVLMKADLLARVGPEPFSVMDEMGEDYSFCVRARSVGARIFVHTGVPVAQIDNSGTAYLPGAPALRVENNCLVQPMVGETRSYGAVVDQIRKRAQEQR